MGSMMKNETDMLTLQVRGDGPLGGITVTADSKGDVKGYVNNPDVMLPPKNGKLDVGGAVGIGLLQVIKDMGLKEPYSGQTILVSSEIAEDLTYYFANSEQVPSSVGLGVLMEKDNTVECAGGFIIQMMPFAKEETISQIEENLKNKKQTILFLNRRGFATFIMCRDCGYTAKCKNCDITLTYHLKENKLKCHYCGYETKALTVCPECGGKNIRYFGTGTQKLEEQIKTMFPDATTIRMDIDTVTKKNSHEDILNSFKKDGIDILIGTQMVVKGHDFPNVTLVGVIAADSSLNIDDYRAHERTFQTLTQVAGRAGRGKDKGRVIIQTYNPDAFCIQYSQQQDYKLFYDTEIHLRKQLRYPPFCDIILIGVSSKSYKELEETSNKIYESLKAKIHTEKLQILLYKPVPAPIDRIKNKFRWRIIVKCIVGEPIINAIDDTVKNAGNKNTKNDTRIIVDVNPSNML